MMRLHTVYALTAAGGMDPELPRETFIVGPAPFCDLSSRGLEEARRQYDELMNEDVPVFKSSLEMEP